MPSVRLTEARRSFPGENVEFSGLNLLADTFARMNPPEPKPDRVANRLTQDVSDEDRVKRRFGDLFEAMPDATVVVDGEGKIVLANSHTERLFGYDREELHGQRLEILLPEQLRDRHVGHRKSFFGDPSIRAMGTGLEFCGRRKDGQEFPVDISLSPLQVEEKSFVVCSIRDVTEQKRAERKLQQALEEIAKLKDRLQAENVYLREEIKSEYSHSENHWSKRRYRASPGPCRASGPD
jgi:PAS domain S-box-containing protein